MLTHTMALCLAGQLLSDPGVSKLEAGGGSFNPMCNHCPQLFHSSHSPVYHSAAGDGDIKVPRTTVSSSIPLPGRGDESPGQH